MCALAEIVAYAKTQACIVLCAKHLLDMSQSVVSAIATLFAHAYAAEWQIQVIYQYQHVLHRNLLLLQPVSNGIAAEVHVGGRLEQDDLSTLDAATRHKTVSFVFPRSILALSKSVQHHKTNIMTRIGILAAYVS